MSTGTFDIVEFIYTNYKGRTAVRRVRPIRIHFGSTAYYPEAQWLLEAVDLDKEATRDFALAKISGWCRAKPREELKLRQDLTCPHCGKAKDTRSDGQGHMICWHCKRVATAYPTPTHSLLE